MDACLGGDGWRNRIAGSWLGIVGFAGSRGTCRWAALGVVDRAGVQLLVSWKELGQASSKKGQDKTKRKDKKDQGQVLTAQQRLDVSVSSLLVVFVSREAAAVGVQRHVGGVQAYRWRAAGSPNLICPRTLALWALQRKQGAPVARPRPTACLSFNGELRVRVD